MKLKKDFQFLVGSDFIDSEGDRQTCIQLVNEESKVIWFGDFTNGEVMRICSVKAIFDLKDEILEECKEILIKSSPTTYGLTFDEKKALDS